ncbi:restriction endonuclease subunit S [Candidatus Halobeggiatoa sp. HSG11]|nr:restriction endonuclease subunit S [Candidatus Halobeggiatoa sp. HSG11]
MNSKPNKWHNIELKNIAIEIKDRVTSEAGEPVYSVTKHIGFVPSLEYFKKRIASRDVKGYKKVQKNQFAYATIHLDEGSIGLLTDVDSVIISPMYTVFQVNEKIVYPPYFIRFMKSPAMVAGYARLGKGSVHRRKAISFSTLSSVKIPLPPLEEQKRIAAILDKADSIRRKRQQAIQLADEFLRSVFLDMFGDPVVNPKGWEVQKLCKITDILTGYAFKSSEYVGLEDGIRLCRGVNILPNFIDWKDTAYWHKNNFDISERFKLMVNDIVIAMDRPWISSGFKIAIIKPDDLPALLLQRVARIRAYKKNLQKYLFFVIQHPAFKLHSNLTETTVPHISPKDLHSYSVPIPDTKSINSFNLIIDKIQKDEGINNKQREAAQQAEQLFNSLAQRAFSGKL